MVARPILILCVYVVGQAAIMDEVPASSYQQQGRGCSNDVLGKGIGEAHVT